MEIRILLLMMSALISMAAATARAEGTCDQALRGMDPAPVFGTNAQCASHRQEFCAHLANLPPGDFNLLAARVDAQGQGTESPLGMAAVLADCGLNYNALLARQCQRAYSQEDLGFVLKHCRFEAWSLARAQCERNADTVSPRYVEFCNLFYTGRAP